MPGTMDTLKTYAIGAVAGLAIYHWVLRKEFPSLPALNAMNSMQRTAVSKLAQENSFLRRNTNQMMQRLAVTQSGEGAPDARQRQRELTFGFMSNREVPMTMGFKDGIWRHPEAKFNPSIDRQRRFGAMGFQQNPAKTYRERKYGFASRASASLNSFGMK